MALPESEERLFKVFSNVSDWLRFAEAKNAMLAAFNAASIYGITKSFEVSFIKNNPYLLFYLGVAILFLVFSSVCVLISFAPRVTIIKGGWYAPSSPPNILFFEYLKTKNADDILTEICGPAPQNGYTRIEKDLAVQIQQNSIIASRKYSYFTIALWLSIAAYITFPLAAFFCLHTYFRD